MSRLDATLLILGFTVIVEILLLCIAACRSNIRDLKSNKGGVW